MVSEVAKKYRIYKRKIRNFINYASINLFIKDKKGEIVSLILNNAQNIFYDAYLEARRSGRLLRFIVLKARQEGISTITEGLIYQRTANQENRKATIVGHDRDAADNLFNMFKRFQKYNPAAPAIKHSNEKKLLFGELGSEIKIASAEGGANVKRSDTIQDLHATEVAFWRDAKATMLALLQTVPDKNNTMIVIESTANGIGGWFHDTWVKATKGENDYIPIFLAWFDLPEYTKPFADLQEQARFIQSMDEYERIIQKTHSLTIEQMNWRRYTKENKCDNDEFQMRQEYPATAKEAFVTTGRPVFDAETVMERYSECVDPIKVGNLEFKYDESAKYAELVEKGKASAFELLDHIIGVKFVEDKHGYITLYDEINVHYTEHDVFAGGCDVAEGLEQGDYSTFEMWDRRDDKVKFVWHGHIDTDLLAEELLKAQMFVNGEVYFNIEHNNHGLAVINPAYKLGVNMYWREDFSKGFNDTKKGILGFKTDRKTKPFIINELKMWIREELFEHPEQEFWGECLTFVKNASGQMQAQGKDKDPGVKCFDDRVIRTALTIKCHTWMASYSKDTVSDLPEWYEKEMGVPEDKTTAMGV